jgi:hypothetical protein
MKVSGHQIEWSYESIAAWPYAYWAHKNGLLTETESGPDSSCVYWYSPKHTIRTDERTWDNMKKAGDLPNLWIHKPRLDTSQWVPPPLKEHFSKTAITFSKPTVVIANRANSEWSRGLINYFDLPTLRALFDILQKKYQIVYLNVKGRPELEDTAKAVDIGDYAMIRKEYPGVKIIHDIVENGSFNETQCRIFAGCSRFVTMNGGYATMCSYFGGENIIYTKECKELRPTVNSFYNWYPDFGGSTIKVVHTYDDLINMVRDKWVRELPLINILVRCHNRPKSLDRLFKSITSQGYRNWNVIASYDNEETFKFLCKYPYYKVKVSPEPPPEQRPQGDEYKGYLAPNLYLNELASYVKDGYITYMDDDDWYAPGALLAIAGGLSKNKLLLWNAKLEVNGRVIPEKKNKGKVVAGDISGIAFAFHKSHLHKVNWTPWRRGDYRVINDLAGYMPVNYMDKDLSIIGKRLDNFSTAERHAKALEHRAKKAEAMNAAVASRRPSELNVEYEVVCPTCPTCGQDIPQK